MTVHFKVQYASEQLNLDNIIKRVTKMGKKKYHMWKKDLIAFTLVKATRKPGPNLPHT